MPRNNSNSAIGTDCVSGISNRNCTKKVNPIRNKTVDTINAIIAIVISIDVYRFFATLHLLIL